MVPFQLGAQQGAIRPSLTYLVIDKSGSISTAGLVDPILGAVTEFVGGLGTNSELRVVYFSDRATKEQSWKPAFNTRAKGEFIRTLQRDFRPAGQTRLFDTVGEVLGTVLSERVKFTSVDVKILSDGDDNLSTKFTNWEMLSPLTKQFATGRDNFITWITLGFDPGNKKPAADSGVITRVETDAGKGFSIERLQPEANPIAAFDATPKTATVGAPVAFRLIYPKGITAAKWTLGDGTTGSGLKFQHLYKKSGTYSVRAEVEGPGGTDAIDMPDFVQVMDEIPVRAAFSANPRKAKIGEDVLFALASSAGAALARWDFGDGTYATNFVATHAYARAGTYKIKVLVEGPTGTDSSELPGGIEVFNELPVSASFSVSPRRARIGEDVLFALDSAAGITSVRWNFGDGGSASNALVRHAYSKVGDYDIAVEVSGTGGKDASTNKALVQIQAEVPLQAGFTWAPKEISEGQEIQFVDESLGGPTKWLWEIPGVGTRSDRSPVVLSGKAGKLSVRLTVERDGEQKSITKEISVQPPPPPSLQAAFRALLTKGTSPLEVEFKDQSKGIVARYLWDFGDGQTSDLRNPSHIYRVEGKNRDFRPRLTIYESTGQEARDIGVVLISVAPPPPWWHQALLVGAIAFAAWVLLIVPILRRQIGLADLREGRFVFRAKTGSSPPVYLLARKPFLRNLFWPRQSILVGSLPGCDLVIQGNGGVLGRIARVPFRRECVLIPAASGNSAICSIKVSKDVLTKAVKTEKTPVVGTIALRDKDEFEIGGIRYVWGA